MDYIRALKKPLEKPEMYLALSFLSWIPLANIYVLGYLLDFAAGNELEGRKMLSRFIKGSKVFAIIVTYSLLPILALYLFGAIEAIAIAALLVPPFSVSICRLARGPIEKALEISVLKRAYGREVLRKTAGAVLTSAVSLVLHAFVPVIGWLGMIYGPLATYFHIAGSMCD